MSTTYTPNEAFMVRLKNAVLERDATVTYVEDRHRARADIDWVKRGVIVELTGDQYVDGGMIFKTAECIVYTLGVCSEPIFADLTVHTYDVISTDDHKPKMMVRFFSPPASSDARAENVTAQVRVAIQELTDAIAGAQRALKTLQDTQFIRTPVPSMQPES